MENVSQRIFDSRTFLELVPIAAVIFGVFGGAVLLAALQSLGYALWFGMKTFPEFTDFARL